ncbi:hypothetical protein E2C01_063969 [Portunus trituberculatus]|uniref:Uncharacterized protein n=1 Tax=Portunus trituberculatus TaxID=210409 RepID=A0A5B7HM08_PORTR|nr:hypothetical protein [Portunus trituberculatus]
MLAPLFDHLMGCDTSMITCLPTIVIYNTITFDTTVYQKKKPVITPPTKETVTSSPSHNLVSVTDPHLPRSFMLSVNTPETSFPSSSSRTRRTPPARQWCDSLQVMPFIVHQRGPPVLIGSNAPRRPLGAEGAARRYIRKGE